MSVATKPVLHLPAEPDPRVVRPPTPPFEKKGTVTVHGYIGEMTKDFINLHHMHDHRAYYEIPIDGIYSCEPKPSKKLKNLFELKVFKKTPIRYYHATTATMPAETLAHAVSTFNKFAPRHPGPDAKGCPVTCPRTCCSDGACICASTFPLGVGHAEVFGVTVSTPEYPKES